MDVAAWLRDLGLGRYERAFRDHAVEAEILPELTEDDLKEMGVVAVGHRRKLLAAIGALHKGSAAAGPGVTSPLPEAERRLVDFKSGAAVGYGESEATTREFVWICRGRPADLTWRAPSAASGSRRPSRRRPS